VPFLFHECPYEGDVDLYNITIGKDVKTRPITHIYPAGFYRTYLKIFYRRKEVLELIISGEMKSDVKETFGK
jgi:hypothetical protein